jgi:XTP/dITP diphosphohydrolase
MRTIVFATENPGKISEVAQFAAQYNIEVITPSQAGLKTVEVEETGTTYEQNAKLKVQAYLGQEAAQHLIICGDDTGVEIPALNNEPGLHTRRWLGYRMSDDEVIGYALGRMHGVIDRKAIFKSTVAYSVNGGEIDIATGELVGHLTDVPMPEAPIQEGVPFRRIFMVDGTPDVPLWQFDELPLDERPEMYSHREAAFMKMFENLNRTTNTSE